METEPATTKPKIVRKMQVVYFYTCMCRVLSKYCDQNHLLAARIPTDVLMEYVINEEDD